MKLSTTQIFSALCILGTPAAAQIQFTPGGTLATGQRPDSVVLADFDLDGDQDMAVSTGPQAGNLDAVEIYTNNGSGTFTLSASILTGNNTSPSGLVAADLNGDGAADLAVALHNSNSVRVLMNNGVGGFALAGITGVGVDPRSVAAGDVDGDGDIDVVSSNRDGNSVTLLTNNGAGVLASGGTTTLGADLRGVAIADFNGDGRGDVVVSSHDTRQIGVLLGSVGGLGAPTMYSVGGNRRSEGLTTGDFNGDGAIDIAAVTSLNDDSWATIFTNSGGTFGAIAHFAFQGVDGDSIVAADFDLDGDLDLATTNQDSNNVSVLSGAGNGTFGLSTVVATGVRPGGIAAGDIDGDGDADLATANRDSNNVSLLQNPGNGVSWTNYCSATANSTGNSAAISASGSNSIAANNFTLQVTNAVPNSSGLFTYASQQGFSALGNGFLCLSGQLFRLHTPTPADGAGAKSQLLNFQVGNPGSGPGMIAAGSTWNFQYWYRDLAGGGQAFNLSNGLNATFGL